LYGYHLLVTKFHACITICMIIVTRSSTIETIITEYTSDVDSSMQIQNGQLKNLYLTLLYSMFRRLYNKYLKQPGIRSGSNRVDT